MYRTPHMMLLHLNISSSSNKHTGNSPTGATVAVNMVPHLGEDPRRPIKVSISPLSRCALGQLSVQYTYIYVLLEHPCAASGRYTPN